MCPGVCGTLSSAPSNRGDPPEPDLTVGRRASHTRPKAGGLLGHQCLVPKPQKPQKDEWSPQRPLAPPPWPSHLLWLQHCKGLGGRSRSELLGVGRSGQIPQAPLGAVPVLAGLRDWAPGPPGTATDPPPPGPALCPFPAHLAWGLRGVHRKRGRWAGQGNWRLKGAGVSLGLLGQPPPERPGSELPPTH